LLDDVFLAKSFFLASLTSDNGWYEGAIGAIATPKHYKNNFIHRNFVQYERQHS